MNDSSKPDTSSDKRGAGETGTATASAWVPALWILLPLLAVILWQLLTSP